MGGVPEPVLDQAQEQEFDGKGVFPCFSNGEMQHSPFPWNTRPGAAAPLRPCTCLDVTGDDHPLDLCRGLVDLQGKPETREPGAGKGV